MIKREGLTLEKALTDLDYWPAGGYVIENGPQMGVYCRPCGESLGLSVSTGDFWSGLMMRADFEDEYGQNCDRCHIQLVAPMPGWSGNNQHEGFDS